jgi:hypothetical protein
MLVLQHIVTHWTKNSRGGAEATKRNAVPETLPISLTQASEVGLLQDVCYREETQFTAKESITPLLLEKSYPIGATIISPTNADGALVKYRWNYWTSGAPERLSNRKDLTLVPGEWCQVVWNGRFTDGDTGQWWYEKHVVNIAVGSITRQLFRETTPTFRYDATVLLF